MPEVFVITPATVKAGQIALTFGTRFLDFFRSEQLFKVEWTGPNYRKEKFLWWTTLEAGEKMVYELRGKPAFCDAILNHLHNKDLIMNDGRVVEHRRFSPLGIPSGTHQADAITPDVEIRIEAPEAQQSPGPSTG